MYAVAQVASSGTVAVVTPTFYAHLEGLPVDVAAYFKLFISFFYSSDTLPHAYDFRRLQILLQLADNALVTGDASWLDLAEYYASLSGLVTIVVAGFSFYYVTIVAVQSNEACSSPLPTCCSSCWSLLPSVSDHRRLQGQTLHACVLRRCCGLGCCLGCHGRLDGSLVLMQAGTSTQSLRGS